jgi:biotin transport system ATP-binding protein
VISFQAARVRVVQASMAGGGEHYRDILGPVTADLSERRVAVIGANGSGKSTLLKLVNGLAQATGGRVEVDGLDPATQGSRVRRRVGFMFTDPLSQLVMPTPREDVELSLRKRIKDQSGRRRAALAALERFGLGNLADQSIYDLSGGERQLLALASVLAVEPKILVADEPTTLLDLRNRDALRQLFRRLDQQIIFTTHDLEFALDSDRVLVVDGGRLAYDGEPAQAVAMYRQLCAVDADT